MIHRTVRSALGDLCIKGPHQGFNVASRAGQVASAFSGGRHEAGLLQLVLPLSTRLLPIPARVHRRRILLYYLVPIVVRSIDMRCPTGMCGIIFRVEGLVCMQGNLNGWGGDESLAVSLNIG